MVKLLKRFVLISCASILVACAKNNDFSPAINTVTPTSTPQHLLTISPLPSAHSPNTTATATATVSVPDVITPTSTPSFLQLRLLKTYDFLGGAFAYSPDNRVIVVSRGKIIEAYDLASEKQVWAFDKPRAELNTLGDVKFSRQGDLLFAKATEAGHESIFVWNWATHKLIRKIELLDLVDDFDVSFDGKWVAVTGETNYAPYIKLVNINTGEVRKISSFATALEFSPTQPVLAEVNSSGGYAVILWNLNGRPYQEIFYQSDIGFYNVADLSFSSDGRLLALIVNDKLRLWDIEQNQEITWPLSLITPSIFRVDFSSQDVLATLDDSGTITLFNAHTGKIIADAHIDIERPDVKLVLYDFSFSPDGKRLLTGFRPIRVWEVPTGE